MWISAINSEKLERYTKSCCVKIIRDGYRNLPGGVLTSYVMHAGEYKTRPNSVIKRYGDRFEYASPEETPRLIADLVDWYNKAEKEGKLSPVELAALRRNLSHLLEQRVFPVKFLLHHITGQIIDSHCFAIRSEI